MQSKECIIALDIGGTNIRIGIVDDKGNIIYKGKYATPSIKSYCYILKFIKKIVNIYITKAKKLSNIEIVGLGIGTAGVFDSSVNEVVGAFSIFGKDNTKWTLRKDLERIIDIETKIDNDVNLAALGEYWLGAGKGYNNIVCIFIGTGIGGGIIIDGKLHRGARGAAGEIGHITIKPNGPKCGCGNYGCFEKMAAGPAFLERAKKLVLKGETFDFINIQKSTIKELTTVKVFQAARQGDKLALKVLHKTACYLGIGIANIINTLNPSLIVLGGSVSKDFDLIINDIMIEIEKRTRIVAKDSVKIVPSLLWDDAALIGAAYLFFNK